MPLKCCKPSLKAPLVCHYSVGSDFGDHVSFKGGKAGSPKVGDSFVKATKIDTISNFGFN